MSIAPPPVDGPLGRDRRPDGRDEIRGVVVVVPVHDEEEHLAQCLLSVHRALDHPAVRHLRTTVVVSLDACRDGSAEIARSRCRRTDVVVEDEHRNVGAARAAGTRAGLAAVGLDPRNVWLAHTDADTVVPRGWLASQLALAPRAHGVAGVVRVHDWAPHLLATRLRFERDYHGPSGVSHPHVHGANLGLRGSAYLAAGGFPHLTCGEDHALWSGLRARGYAVEATRRVWVVTSARRRARASGGFADTLLAIERAAGIG